MSTKKKSKKKSKNVPVDEEEVERLRLIAQAIEFKKSIIKAEGHIAQFKDRLKRVKFAWEIGKQKCFDKKIELANKQSHIKQLKDDHQNDLDLYKQKIKHCLYENQQHLSLQAREIEGGLEKLQADCLSQDEELKQDINELRLHLKEKELSHSVFIQNLKREHSTNLSQVKKEYLRKRTELIASCENTLKITKEKKEAAIRAQIIELEKKKDNQICRLMQSHLQALNKIRKERGKIIEDNLSKIKELKESIQELKKHEKHDEKVLKEVILQSKNIKEPLEKGKIDIVVLSKRLEAYRFEKEELNNKKELLNNLQLELSDLKWRHEVLYQRFIAIEAERDEYQNKVRAAMYESQQKNYLKNAILDKQIINTINKRDVHNATINELLVGEKIDSKTVTMIQTKLKNIGHEKQVIIREIEKEISQVKQDRQKLRKDCQSILSDSFL